MEHDARQAAIEELRSALRWAREASGYEIGARGREAVEKAIDAIEDAIAILLPDGP